MPSDGGGLPHFVGTNLDVANANIGTLVANAITSGNLVVVVGNGIDVSSAGVLSLGPTNATAVVFGGHLVSSATGTPTTTNLGANVTSATFTGNDTRGTIAIVMSGALAANTRVCTATFAASYGATPPKVTLVDQTSAVGLTIVNSYVLAQSTGVSFDIAFDQALGTGTYTLDYIVIG